VSVVVVVVLSLTTCNGHRFGVIVSTRQKGEDAENQREKERGKLIEFNIENAIFILFNVQNQLSLLDP
jgi:hypothetical protein